MAKPSEEKLNHPKKPHEVQPSKAKAIPCHQTPLKHGSQQDRPHIRSVKRSERVER